MSRSESEPRSCCSTTASTNSQSAVASTELKLYQAFIFAVPVFFTVILLFLFYLFYLRRRRVDWASLRMRTSLQDHSVDISRVEMGLKKELREMLPIIVYKESFSVRDTQCPVCLGDYQAEDKLQQIPACGHTFHMDCIDHWLANHTTCPLCRLSLLASAKAPSEPPRNQVETVQESSVAGEEAPVQPRPESCEESQAMPLSQSMDEESGTLQNSAGEEQRSECADQGREFRFARNEAEEHDNSRDSSAQRHA
ncbi:hypothetical protein OIU84_017449 [Salix udensis]|uniref:RING-type E3 ubiquitin transferase n=1 Tax=Salix udensis TaxID=889485 RepID=A0AAD6L219_9ROSI|nr:hypothetical protein OIU84_017449 [Salix udensis]